MPEWWGMFLVIVFGIIVAGIFISGCIKLFAYLGKRSEESVSYESGKIVGKKSINALILISILAAPTVLTSLSAINWLARDKSKDAFGFSRPAYEEKHGFETRSLRRMRGIGNLIKFIFSLHGIASLLIAGIVFIPFVLIISKINAEVHTLKNIDGYWAVAVPIALVFFILYAKS